jgi:hypothetical protein
VEGIHLAGAHQFYDAHVGGILQAHGTGEVGGRIGAVVAAENNWCKITRY